MTKKIVVIVLSAVGLLVFGLQFQPWSDTIKPFGPSVADEHRVLQEELRALNQEARTHRLIAKLENGGTLPPFDEAAKKNPALADYRRRLDDHKVRAQAFYEAHPNIPR